MSRIATIGWALHFAGICCFFVRYDTPWEAYCLSSSLRWVDTGVTGEWIASSLLSPFDQLIDERMSVVHCSDLSVLSMSYDYDACV